MACFPLKIRKKISIFFLIIYIKYLLKAPATAKKKYGAQRLKGISDTLFANPYDYLHNKPEGSTNITMFHRS